MDNSNVLVRGNHQVNEEKPPPRVCPRCSSDNTKFCFYDNYSVSQPRYNCRSCRRFWTHGGVLRNIPIGGRARKVKHTRIDQPSVSQVVSVVEQVNNHQPFSHAQETNEFLGTFGGSSSSVAVGNHFSSSTETHSVMVPPIRSIQEDPNKQNQSFNNSMNMNHSASTSGSREYPGIDHMINNSNKKYVFRSSYHLEKHGP